MADKQFALSNDQLKPLAENRGGCLATDMIMVEGCKVGYMYRDQPHNVLDSGWVFTAGQETQEYMDDSSNHGIYDINTIALTIPPSPFTAIRIGERSLTKAALRLSV